MVHLSFLVGQLSGAKARSFIDEKGGLYFLVTLLTGLVEEKIDQRPLQAGTLPPVNRESGPGKFYSELKIDEIIFGCQLPVRQCPLFKAGDLPARWKLVVGPRGLNASMLLAIARMGAGGAVRVLDGGNRFNAYPVARAARGWRRIAPTTRTPVGRPRPLTSSLAMEGGSCE